MTRFWLTCVALFALTAKAQNINYQDVQHVHTSLKHLTVIDVGEQVQFIAAADTAAFQIERAGDKVLLQPLKDGASTNLILWTPSRQISYELDAPGDVAQMNVLVRNLPVVAKVQPSSRTLQEQSTRAAIAEAILGAQDVVPDGHSKVASDAVSVSITRVLHSGDGVYLEYRIRNGAAAPFRATTPIVARLLPTDVPFSLTAMRNHQLTPRVVSTMKTKPAKGEEILGADCSETDIPAGASAVGYVMIRSNDSSSPEVLQLNFGSTPAGALADTVVI